MFYTSFSKYPSWLVLSFRHQAMGQYNVHYTHWHEFVLIRILQFEKCACVRKFIINKNIFKFMVKTAMDDNADVQILLHGGPGCRKEFYLPTIYFHR